MLQIDIVPVCRELGIGIVAYSPIGRGFLAGKYKSAEDLPPDDFRRSIPRFAQAAFDKVSPVLSTLAACGSTPAFGLVSPAQNTTVLWLAQQHASDCSVSHCFAIMHSCNGYAPCLVNTAHVKGAGACLPLPGEALSKSRMLQVKWESVGCTLACTNILVQNLKLADNVKRLAQKKGVTSGQMALAWLHHQVSPGDARNEVAPIGESTHCQAVMFGLEDTPRACTDDLHQTLYTPMWLLPSSFPAFPSCLQQHSTTLQALSGYPGGLIMIWH